MHKIHCKPTLILLTLHIFFILSKSHEITGDPTSIKETTANANYNKINSSLFQYSNIAQRFKILEEIKPNHVKSFASQIFRRKLTKLLKHSKIGEGSQGIILKVRDVAKKKVMVLKKFKYSPYEDDESISMKNSRFRKEIELTRRAQRCPHVVRLASKKRNDFKLLDEDGNHMMLLEFYGGGDLFEFTRSAHQIDSFMKLLPNWLGQIAVAIECLHDIGIIFQDLKPENIVLSEDHEKAYLIDFGLSVETTEWQLKKVGSTRFMPPEAFIRGSIRQTNTTDRTSLAYAWDHWGFAMVILDTISFPLGSTLISEPMLSLFVFDGGSSSVVDTQHVTHFDPDAFTTWMKKNIGRLQSYISSLKETPETAEKSLEIHKVLNLMRECNKPDFLASLNALMNLNVMYRSISEYLLWTAKHTKDEELQRECYTYSNPARPNPYEGILGEMKKATSAIVVPPNIQQSKTRKKVKHMKYTDIDSLHAPLLPRQTTTKRSKGRFRACFKCFQSSEDDDKN